MSFWTRLADLVKRDSPVRLSRPIPDADLRAQDVLRPDQALNLSTVWRCATLIGESIANSPWEIFTVDADGTRVEAPSDPLSWLLNVRPNADTTAQALKEALVIETMCSDYGSGYLEIVKDLGGRVSELRLLLSDRVMMFRYGDPASLAPTEWPVLPSPAVGDLIYRYLELDGSHSWLRQDQVFHLRGPSTNALFGDSLITRAAKAAAIAHAQDSFALSYYARGSAPTGVLKYDGNLDNAKTRQEVKADFESNATGPVNGRKPLVLEKGWDWTQVSALNANESMVIPARQFSVDDIARFFGVPGALLNQNVQLPGQDLEGLGLIFVRYGLTSWKHRLEQEAAVKLIPPRTKKITNIDLTWLTHGNAQSIASTHRTYIETGVLTINEVRDDLGRDGIGPDGDLHVIEKKLTVLDEETLTADSGAGAQTAVSGTQSDPAGAQSGGEGETMDEVEGDAAVTEGA